MQEQRGDFDFLHKCQVARLYIQTENHLLVNFEQVIGLSKLWMSFLNVFRQPQRIHGPVENKSNLCSIVPFINNVRLAIATILG